MVRAWSIARFLVALVVAAIAAPLFFTLSLNVLLNPNGIFTEAFWGKVVSFSIFAVAFGSLGAFVILGVCYRVVLNQRSLHESDIFLASFIAALVHSIVGFIVGSLNGGAAMLLGFFFELAALMDHRSDIYGWVFASKVIGGLAAGVLFLIVLGKDPIEE
jgi:hypothetical protein